MTAKLVLLGGFLGAGKTTTLINTARKLEQSGHVVGIVTNDQGKELIDTELAKSSGLEPKEITGGCFCCKFDDLYANMNELMEEKKPDFIIAEAVGSCTDLIATVIQPLKQYYSKEFKTAPLTIVVDPERLLGDLELSNDETPNFSQSVDYIFEKQLAEADIIAVNKSDIHSPEVIAKVKKYLQNRYPQTVIQEISASADHNLDELISIWKTSDVGGDKVLDIDYDIYAAGEAKLAWMNILGDIHASTSIDPYVWVQTFLDKLSAHIERENMPIAHLKVHAGLENNGFVKASLVKTGAAATYTVENAQSATFIRLVLNIRIETEPDKLNLIVQDSIESTNEKVGTTWNGTYHECFSPLPPEPIHRLQKV
ncbi:GTP-binding protein [Shouchella sp. JSM 1781072]|uniref:GTP-binding protein n=1 Tax=Bacillaceae TaxID=186817 RepID=UPI0020D05D48|nr:GTP-binding protein [Alkalihalobacillus sp. LMS6]UTR06721.1 cobalamin biosynthesis protein [Alkalihalobacillus sp. LMS6]